ncbi:MAG: leucyl aminopeptidase [Bacteroidetes bacterium]|nr:leucyl aminopeptidase [Bacteroidota bacterium]
MPKCTGQYGTPERIQADVYAIPIPSETTLFDKTVKQICPELRNLISALRENGDFSGKADETVTLATEEGRFVLVGLGDTDAMGVERVRRAAAQAMKEAAKFVAPVVALYCPLEEIVRKILPVSFEETAVAMVEGALLSLYSYDAFRKKKADQKKGQIREVMIVTVDEGYQSRLKKGIQEAQIMVEAVELARNLANAPANVVDADALAKEAATIGKKLGIKTVILKKTEIVANKMGGLLAVNRGSEKDPRFIVMEYNDKKQRLKPYVLVGKGITFDAGGLSIKPASAMEDMKTDMSGAAAVLGTMYAIAKLKLPIRVIALIPATDNMTGGGALCPGDIITMSDGTTVEVRNTDAEGRLILADALLYAQRYKPAAVIDIATLTGAVVVALASHATGMMGTDEELKETLQVAGDATYERVWELPLFDEYAKMMESDIADLKNIGGRWGGAVTAAMFLKHFTGDLPWIHLDIAGTASIEKATDYQPKGATGIGVRLLTRFLQQMK